VRIVSPHRKTHSIKLHDVVQTALLPLLLPPERRKRSLYLPYDPPSDICVSAPTGSGKTLAYVLPIVEVCAFRRDPRLWSDVREEIFSTRAVTHLRALVVLPTRDLVVQVRETFEAIAKGRGLKVRDSCLISLSSLLKSSIIR
jgi:ATP-dependent RNA helicase DDX51/DBP6